MEKHGNGEDAVSPVIGVVLLVAMTVLMVSLIALSVLAFEPPQPAPYAKILVVEAKGGIDENLYENTIMLKHKGGDTLDEKNTKIILSGKGYTYYSGKDPHTKSMEDIQVTYIDLSGNNYGGEDGEKLGEIVGGTTWDAGETIKLYGSDGINLPKSIKYKQGTSVNYKWKLAEGSTVSVIVIDIPTNQIIAVSKTTVKPT